MNEWTEKLLAQADHEHDLNYMGICVHCHKNVEQIQEQQIRALQIEATERLVRVLEKLEIRLGLM